MKLDPKTTAVLTLDLQQGILGMAANAESVLPNAAKAVKWAREHHALLIHVGLGFEAGHPELPADHKMLARIRDNNLFVRGTPSAAFHPSVFEPNDLVIYKQRVSAFSENHLHTVLRARGIKTLVLSGISTSGIVLSTVRRASDLDYTIVVLEDACFDPDEETHRVLTQKVYPRQATVLTVEAFLSEQK